MMPLLARLPLGLVHALGVLSGNLELSGQRLDDRCNAHVNPRTCRSTPSLGRKD